MNKKSQSRLRPGQRPVLSSPFGVAALSLTLMLALAGCTGSGIEEVASGQREAAPHFALEVVSGGTVGTNEIAGKVVLLDFWATWCAPCHIQTEILGEIYEELRESGVESGDFEILSIDTNEKPERVAAFMDKNPASFPVLLDVEGTVSDGFGVVALPTVVLLDRQGRIAFTATGITEAEELRPWILKELGTGFEAAG